jgi:hypothetical protein
MRIGRAGIRLLISIVVCLTAVSPVHLPAQAAPGQGCVAVGAPYGMCSFVSTEGPVTVIGAALTVVVYDQYGYYPIQGMFAGVATFYYFRPDSVVTVSAFGGAVEAVNGGGIPL